MNRLSITVELAADGGCVVYADNGGTEQALVYAGNTKDTCDYIAKRVGGLKAESAGCSYENQIAGGTRRVYGNPNNAVELFAVEA